MKRLARVHKTKKLIVIQTAADIIHQVTKKLIDLSVEGAKVIDLCIEGDKLIEQGTGAVYNKNVKGVKVPKGSIFTMTKSCQQLIEES